MENSIAGSKPTSISFSSVMSRVFGWMFLGLALTGATAYFVSSSKIMIDFIFSNPFFLFGLVIVELVLVIVLASQVMKLASGVALGLFFLYSILNGVTLSTIFIFYTIGSIAITFLVASLMFGVMALYGYITKKDLTGWGNFLFMALIGIIIAMFINMFFRSTTADYIISGIGIIIFVGLTAFNVQKIKQFLSMAHSEEDKKKVSVAGALSLYLDFINIFLYLLRFTGKAR
jgi:hypothetical protein